jgi:cytoskeletal protein CcmA (bactofilin family)
MDGMLAQPALALTINGELTAGEDLTIDYVFDGSIQLKGHHLTIAKGSRVHAAVEADTVTVHGHFEGQIEAEALHVSASASVNATAIAKKLTIQEGAEFTGAVNTERARAAGDIAKHRASQK